MAKGTIRRLITDRGFGFIKSSEGTDLFFHRNELQGVEFFDLREGQEVEYDTGKGRDGRPQAVAVKLAEAGAKEEPPPTEETTEAPEAAEEAEESKEAEESEEAKSSEEGSAESS